MDKIVKTMIVSNEEGKKGLGSTVVRGAVGGALLGPVGMLGGALTGKKKKGTTTFLITYDSGRKETMTVKNNSLLFNTYCQYLDE